MHNELKTLDTQISKIKEHINNNNKDTLNDIPIYKSASLIGKKNIEEKILQTGDISIENMDKTNFKYYQN